MPRQRGRLLSGGALCLATMWGTSSFVAPTPGVRNAPQVGAAAEVHTGPAAVQGPVGGTFSTSGAVLAAGVCGLVAQRAIKAGRRATVGDASPTFSLPDETGRTVTPETYDGKNLLIWWYPKADTGG
eukprot:TRINITY_DN2479_c0_g2_i1.p4 TRINITY_DN2479_c0_g2~~TRINITY_DN2479_c0_g2_i1.p4  ORF type:complete len:127 (-),score=18.76 TRINITY_DN2479_c0_g2_i1:729-1109(-)